MVFVDFSTPAVQAIFRAWLCEHEARIRALTSSLPSLIESSLAAAENSRDFRPLGLVLDIDETVLCNIHMNAHTGFAAAPSAGGLRPSGASNGAAEQGAPFRVADCFDFRIPPGAWTWSDVTRGSGDDISPPYPGAAELVATAKKLGLTVFYVSGRRERLRAETNDNLYLTGLDPGEAYSAPPGRGCLSCGSRRERVPNLYLLPDEYDLTPEGEARGSVRPFKESCRERIERTHRILATVGDQLSDFGAHCGDNQFLFGHSFYFTP